MPRTAVTSISTSVAAALTAGGPRATQINPRDFFKSIVIADPDLRTNALANLSERLAKTARENRASLPDLILTAQRLAVECPFADVRTAMTVFIAMFEDEFGAALPPPLPSSDFIAADALVDRTAVDSPANSLFEWSFLTHGSVPNLVHVLAYHPTYLECVLSTHDVVLYGDGPLPVPWRCYIAIMAAARHACTYLVRQQEDAFLAAGGDPEWLRGTCGNPALPPKLAALTELTALLAHRPWQLNAGHIRSLVTGSLAQEIAARQQHGNRAECTAAGGADGAGTPLSAQLSHSSLLLGQPSSSGGGGGSGGSSATGGGSLGWSVNELVHAIVIICCYTSTCTVVQSLGINRCVCCVCLGARGATILCDCPGCIEPLCYYYSTTICRELVAFIVV